MENIKGIYWGVFLGQGLELMESLLVVGELLRSTECFSYVLLVMYQMVSLLVTLGKIYWKDYLVQIVELREAMPVGCQMAVLIDVELLVEYWEPLLFL